jgi:hypothetical protein
LFETKYWLNRVIARNLMSSAQAQDYVSRLSALARQLNAFAASLKTVCSEQKQSKTLRETATEYKTDLLGDLSEPLFTVQDIAWLES